MADKKLEYPIFTTEVMKSIITAAGNAIELGRYEEVEAMGMPVRIINLLAELSTTEQSSLLRMSRRLTWPVHWKHLEKLIEFARSDSKKTRTLNSLIQARAPWPVLRDLYGITELEFAQRRRLFGLPKSAGRCHAPRPSQDEKIHGVWNKSAHLPLAERLLLIHQRTGIPVNTICLSIKQELCHHKETEQ